MGAPQDWHTICRTPIVRAKRTKLGNLNIRLLGDADMLTINDLSACKELDRTAMSAVTGGGKFARYVRVANNILAGAMCGALTQHLCKKTMP